jgi:F0F1-type ATP synthase membrane subunit b/b'
VTHIAETTDSITPGGETVDDTLAQVEQTVDGALADADAAVDEAVAQAEQTVDGALADADAAVAEAVAQAEQTVDGAAADADAAVAEAVAQADQTVDGATAQADAAVDDTLAQADRTVDEALADGSQIAAGATGGGEAATGGPPAPGAEAVVPPTSADASLPGSESGAAAGSLDGDLTGAGSPDGLLGDPPLWSQPFAESLFTEPPAHSPVAAAPPPAADGGSGLDGLVTTATDPRVMTATGVAVLVAGGLGIWRGGPQLADASVMFTNVRLLPSLIKDGLADHAGTVAAALGRRGPEAAAQFTVPPPGTESVGSGALTGFGAPFREGFGQGVRGGREISDAVVDSRLMIQLGMGLGVVYSLFLSVWFWATRRRRNASA